MADAAIRADRLGKKYRIGVRRDPYGRLTESLWDAMSRPLRRGENQARGADFWALRDVTFEIPRGSAVGVIGRNGAGKSTLLKILSRVTTPTAGRAELHGRVGSLLEVGTGFHPELSGRENVFLSGAILGMRRAEIARHFDAIVDFADIGAFLDTPVKRYSSGMKVRLGFAVAAFLEPEIMLVDEVLAVGDAEFQKKCLGKMSEIGAGGRTVVFVSHSMGAVTRLCERALLLDRGRVVAEGLTGEVVRTYLESGSGRPSVRAWDDVGAAPGDEVVRLLSVRVLGPDGAPADEIDIVEPVDVEVIYHASGPGPLKPAVSLHFFNDEGVILFSSTDWSDRSWLATPRATGYVRAVCHVPGDLLAEGRVNVSVFVASHNPFLLHAEERDAVAFHVVDRTTGEGVRGPFVGDWPGVVRPDLAWEVSQAAD
jgi:lipopolysaccharide transport system ATP-binding protein